MSEKETYNVYGWVSEPIDVEIEAESYEEATELGTEKLREEYEEGGRTVEVDGTYKRD